MKKTFPAIACGLGLLIVAFSYVWPRLVGTGQAWTMEQHDEYARTVAEIHQGTEVTDQAHDERPSAGSSQNGPSQKLEQAKARLDRLNEQLEAARTGRAATSRIIKWSGIALVLVGVVAHFIHHHSS